MDKTEKIEKRLGIICPGTTKFHVCTDKASRFVGCCAVDPCSTSDGNCPQESLDSTSFHKLSYTDVPPQACVNKKAAGGLWYTCAEIQPPFMGCCAVNPCSPGGCPAVSLRAAALSDNKTAADIFLGQDPASSSSSVLSSATSSATSAPSDGQSSPGPSKAAVAGISAGAAVAAILLLTVLIIWLRKRFEVKRKQQQQQQQQQQWQDPSAANGNAGGGGVPSTQHNLSPNMQSIVSPCTTPGTLTNSPYMGFQPSPPQQWNSYQAHHDARHLSGASVMTAELSAGASDEAHKAHDEKVRAAKMEHGPAELGSGRPARMIPPAELEDPTTYDSGARPAQR